MGSPIAGSWVHATVRIENEWGESGTGFLVVRKTNQEEGKVFLVTNKHVVSDDPQVRDSARHITVFVNVRGDDGALAARSFRFPLVANGEKIWREHPGLHIDVLAVDVTSLIITVAEVEKKWADYSLFATSDILRQEEITVGEEVVIIGYPLGLAHARTNSPLVRQGMIATRIGEPIHIPVKLPSGETQQVEIPGFLVDSAVVPGSSGSPVVLKPVIGRKFQDSIRMGIPAPYLLGILSGTSLAPIKHQGRVFPTLSGLGIAYDAVTVQETIELFF